MKKADAPKNKGASAFSKEKVNHYKNWLALYG